MESLFLILLKCNIIAGNTERSILENIDMIIEKSLPKDKVEAYYKEVDGASKDVVLGYVTYTNETQKVIAVTTIHEYYTLHDFMTPAANIQSVLLYSKYPVSVTMC